MSPAAFIKVMARKLSLYEAETWSRDGVLLDGSAPAVRDGGGLE